MIDSSKKAMYVAREIIEFENINSNNKQIDKKNQYK
jgi:hypothetical protein